MIKMRVKIGLICSALSLAFLLAACVSPSCPSSVPIATTAVPSPTPPSPTISATLAATSTSVPPGSTGVPELQRTLVSTQHLVPLYWSKHEQAFILLSWKGEQWALDPGTGELRLHRDKLVDHEPLLFFLAWASQRWIFDPDAGEYHPYDVLERRAQIDESIGHELGVDEKLPYEVSLNGSKLLYHRQSADGQDNQLWFADLGNGYTQFVFTTTMRFDVVPFFEDIVWCNDGQEALLTRTSGESIVIGRFNTSSDEIVPWYETLDLASQEVLDHIAPTFIALSPDTHRLAFVAWSEGPGNDKLWLADLIENHIDLIGLAYAGTAPLWSPDGRYIYFMSTESPTQLGTFEPGNPIGVSRFDVQSWQTTYLIYPGQLGKSDIQQWAISSDEQHIVYSAEDGTWWVEIPR